MTPNEKKQLAANVLSAVAVGLVFFAHRLAGGTPQILEGKDHG